MLVTEGLWLWPAFRTAGLGKFSSWSFDGVKCVVLLVCGGELTASYGSINSPGYPGNYPPGRDCYWTVAVQPGRLLTFAFGTLSLEQHPDCNFDFLEVRNAGLSHIKLSPASRCATETAFLFKARPSNPAPSYLVAIRCYMAL